MTNKQLYRQYQLSRSSELRDLIVRNAIRDIDTFKFVTASDTVVAAVQSPYHQFSELINNLYETSIELQTEAAGAYKQLLVLDNEGLLQEKIGRDKNSKLFLENLEKAYNLLKDFHSYMKVSTQVTKNLASTEPRFQKLFDFLDKIQGKRKEEKSEFYSREDEEKKSDIKPFFKWVSIKKVPETASKIRRILEEREISKDEQGVLFGLLVDFYKDTSHLNDDDAKFKSRKFLKDLDLQIIKEGQSTFRRLSAQGDTFNVWNRIVSVMEEKVKPQVQKLQKVYKELEIAWQDPKYEGNLKGLKNFINGIGEKGVGLLEMGDFFVDETKKLVEEVLPRELTNEEKEKKEEQKKEKQERVEVSKGLMDDLTQKDIDEVKKIMKHTMEVEKKSIEKLPDGDAKNQATEQLKIIEEEYQKVMESISKEEFDKLKGTMPELTEEERAQGLEKMKPQYAGLSRRAAHPLVEKMLDSLKNIQKIVEPKKDVTKEEPKDLLKSATDMFVKALKGAIDTKVSPNQIIKELRGKVVVNEGQLVPELKKVIIDFKKVLFRDIDQAIRVLTDDKEKLNRFFKGDVAIQKQVSNDLTRKILNVWEQYKSQFSKVIMAQSAEGKAVASLSIFAAEEEERSTEDRLKLFLQNYFTPVKVTDILKKVFKEAIDKTEKL